MQTDKWSEFTNKVFQKWLEKEKKNPFFTTHDEQTKASIVERFNRTIKPRMRRYFTSKTTNRYIDILPKLTHSYNHSFH